MNKLKELIFKVINEIRARKYFKSVNANANYDKIIIFSTPLHTNIGDQAIIRSTLQFMEDNLSDKVVIEVPRIYNNYFIKKMIVTENDIVVIHGGGFFGTLYPVEAEAFLKVIKKYSKNKIVVMPQTIYIENDNSKYDEDYFKSIICKAENIIFFAREKESFDYALKTGWFTNVKLVPDIVLYSNEDFMPVSRSNVLFVFRGDKEATHSINIDELARKIKNKYNLKVLISSTMHTEDVSILERDIIVRNKLDEFLKSKITITDRLHGMIFAYITGTPCIAIDNLSRKSSNIYNYWLKGSKNIILLNEVNYANIDRSIEKLLQLSPIKEELIFKSDFTELILELSNPN